MPRNSHLALTRADPLLKTAAAPGDAPGLKAGLRQPTEKARLLLGYGAALLALLIGFIALKLSPASKIGPYGLISAVSPLYHLALVLLIASYAYSLRTRTRRTLLLGTHLVILVFLVHGAPSIIEGAARFQTAYLHVGFIDYIANTGQLLPGLDARFNWPSFFELFAIFDKVAGVSSADIFLRWWPTVINLLYLPLIWHLARQFLRSGMKAWVAVAIFPLANWEAQDYFSPQALNFLLYLTFIYILVVPLGASDRPGWKRLLRRGDPAPAAPAETASAQAGAKPRLPVGFYLAALVLLMVAMATGHQLTPIMVVVAVIVLVVTGRTQVRGMVLIVPLIAVGWICYGAETFWAGHIQMMIGGVGNLGGNVDSGVAGRASGSAAHAFTGHIRELMAVMVWGLALLGSVIWRPRNGDRAVLLLLFFGAFSLLAGGDYGGEGILRVYLFSLPSAVCLIAALISRLPRFWHGQVALASVLILSVPLFLVARWGNEQFESITPDELAGTNALYDMAPPGSTLVTMDGFATFRYKDIVAYDYKTVDEGNSNPISVADITALAKGNPKGAYVLITEQQIAYEYLVDGMPANWGSKLESELAHSKHYKVRWSSPNASVFQYVPPAKPAKSKSKSAGTKHKQAKAHA